MGIQSESNTTVQAWMNNDAFKAAWTKYQELNSAKSPRETPFLKKYEARSILQQLLNELEAIEASNPTKEDEGIKKAKGYMLYQKGMNHINTEEPAERLLSSALSLLKPFASDRLYICSAIDLINQLGILRNDMQQDPREAVGYFEDAEQVYKDYMASDQGPPIPEYVITTSHDQARTEMNSNEHRLQSFCS
jgi:hypothetical protein